MTTVVRERYELLETLGAGGEARVVKALDRQHGRFVALKIRPPRTGEARDLLLNEARILLAVPPHPSLPLVREDFFDGDDYVVAMDWVDGTNLATLVQDRGRPGLAPSSVLAYLSDAAQALTHLHAQGPPVIHGDVKPGNLILTTGGRVKLVDFGMSSAPNALRRRSGTPGFRAPELAASGAALPRQRRLRARRDRIRPAHWVDAGGGAARVGGDRPRPGTAARGGDPPGYGDRPGASAGVSRRVRRAAACRLGGGAADRSDHVLPHEPRGLHRALGVAPGGDGRGGGPPRRAHLRSCVGPRRSSHQVDGRGRLDGVGLRTPARHELPWRRRSPHEPWPA